jgi:hypothetical protein
MRIAKPIAAVLATALAACGGGALQDQARSAMPRSENVKMSSPNSASAARPDGTIAQNSAVGDASVYMAATVGLAVTVNGSSALILGILKAVTDQPATSCTEDTCTWGPGSHPLEANNFKLVVTKKSNPDRFEYALSGEGKSKPGSGFVTFLTGTAVASGTPHRGSGTFTIDNDAHAQLDNPGSDIGKITIDYSNTSLLSITATGTGLKDNDHPGQKINVGYHYADNADGGDLDVQFKSQATAGTTSLHSRWKSTGAGRADVQVKTTAGATALTLNECWGPASASFKVVYYADAITATAATDAACAFTGASFGIVVAP